MNQQTLNRLVSWALLLSIICTAILGTIQSEFELRRFFPHRYAAYVTLILVVIHLFLNRHALLPRRRHPANSESED
jgi:branched-subunit amino acid ABC-type transport system permease component